MDKAAERMIAILENMAPGGTINCEDINTVIDELGGQRHFDPGDSVEIAVLYVTLLINRSK